MDPIDIRSTPKAQPWTNFIRIIVEGGRKIAGQIQAVWKPVSERVSIGFEALIDNKPRLLLSVLAVVWLLPGTGSLPFVDRDEPRFAHATQEMMDSPEEGAWTVPYFNSQYRFDKPPVVYWWMRMHYKMFGYNEMSARLHSVEATVLVVLTS